MTAQETFVADGARTTLTSGITATDLTINVSSTTGFPSVPFYAVIDPGNAAKREIVLVDSGTTATTMTLTGVGKRGMGATSGVDHDSGAVIGIYPVSLLWEDINDRVDAVSATSVNDHGNLNGLADDDHPQYALSAGDTFTGAVSFSDNNVSRANLIDFSEQVQAITQGTDSLALNYTQGQIVALTLNASITSFSITNPPTQGGSLTFVITQGTGGSKTITWGASVKWAGGTPPTLSTATGDIDIVSLIKPTGSTWYGFLGGKDFS